MTNDLIKFNISASMLGAYQQSQLQWALKSLLKCKPDTWVPECYGQGGNLVHEFCEDYINGKKYGECMIKFLKGWE